MHKAVRFALALALLGTSASAQTTVDLTVDQASDVATQALFADDFRLSLQIAEAILLQFPDDRQSLLIVAAAAPRVGDPKRGREAGARAWAVSTTDVQKYEAARLTALAAANEERYTLSTFWLRRALTVAPNEDERARTLNDARAVTRLNPWSSNLSFSLAPSNNVNGGAEDEDLFVAGSDTGGTISEDGLALAGWRATLGFGTRYRFQQNADSRSIIGVSYQGSRVWLTDDTDVTNDALSTDALQWNLRHERALENGTVGISLSHTTFQYRDFKLRTKESTLENYDTTRIAVDRRLALSDRTMLSLSAIQERVDYSIDGIGRVDRTTAGVGLSFLLESKDRVTVNLSVNKADGDNVNYISHGQSLNVTYSWAEPIGPVSLSAGAGVSLRNFPDFQVFTLPSGFAPIDGGRNDSTVSANLNIGFPQVSYAGFSPGLRIDASRTRSNVSRYDRTTFSAGLTISSSF
jgi:hypothetical protein